jgi:hypothetical protein
MNKYGFISLILTFILFLLQFIPVGFFFQFENPIVNSYIRIPIQLFTYEDKQLFFWGIQSNGIFQLWFDINYLTGVFFIFLTPLAILVNILGFWRENKIGKKLMNVNFILILVIFLYSIIGIPIYSKEILGVQFGYFDIFLHLNYGFFIMLINLIVAGIGFGKYPIQ